MKVWDKGKNTKFIELKELDYFPELILFQGNIEIHDLKKKFGTSFQCSNRNNKIKGQSKTKESLTNYILKKIVVTVCSAAHCFKIVIPYQIKIIYI